MSLSDSKISSKLFGMPGSTWKGAYSFILWKWSLSKLPGSAACGTRARTLFMASAKSVRKASTRPGVAAVTRVASSSAASSTNP